MKMTISTIRHARTTFNDEKRYAGSIDVGLSEKGILEAQMASAKLSTIRFDVIVTSTMLRAYDTAKIISSNSVPIVKNQLCNERNFGIMEGLTWDDIQNLDPPVLMISVGHDLHTVNPKGGEPFENVWERAKKFKRFLFLEYKGLQLLVVSHGVFLQMFHGVLRGLNCIESLAFYPANLELTRFDFSDNRCVGENVIRLGEVEEVSW